MLSFITGKSVSTSYFVHDTKKKKPWLEKNTVDLQQFCLSFRTISKCVKVDHSSAQTIVRVEIPRDHTSIKPLTEMHALCLLRTYFGKKSTNQSHNSKAPCGDAGGYSSYSSKIIYIPSKTFMDIILKKHSAGKKLLLQHHQTNTVNSLQLQMETQQFIHIMDDMIWEGNQTDIFKHFLKTSARNIKACSQMVLPSGKGLKDNNVKILEWLPEALTSTKRKSVGKKHFHSLILKIKSDILTNNLIKTNNVYQNSMSGIVGGKKVLSHITFVVNE